MKVFIEPTGRRIEPFGDAVGATPIGNRRLDERLAEAIAGAGLTPIDRLEPPCLVVPDTLWCTAGALRQFIDKAAGRDAVLVAQTCRFIEATAKVQPDVHPVEGGVRFDKIRLVIDGAEPVEVAIDLDEEPVDLGSLPYVSDQSMPFGLPRDVVMTMHHWVHILWANLFVGAVDMRNTPKWRLLTKGAWAALRAFSLNKWKVMGKFNTIGKGCDIHPTAVVEASTLGDGVVVGPFARVIASNLGDGAQVWPYGLVEVCTMGPRSVVTEHSTLRFSVLYPEAVVGQYLMQMCVLGEKVLTTGAGFTMDLNFDRSVRVPLDGALHDTGSPFLGAAFGHRSRIGTGFWLASGRMVPNDYFLIRHPDQVLSKLPPGLAEQNPVAVQGRGLIALGSKD